MADGFLGRWSRRKLETEAGKPVPAEPVPPQPPEPAMAAAQPRLDQADPLAQNTPPPERPAPTMDDVAALTPDADFSRFVSSEVAPEVKTAAMKKLFADPHFNIMDGLDTYIDDYGLPDPIPPQMLKSLASAEFLGLFREEGKDKSAQMLPSEYPAPGLSSPESVAQCSSPDDLAPEPTLAATDADPDLRLQQDPAPGCPDPGDRPE